MIETFRDNSAEKNKIHEYEDTLSYLYYLSGKSARQNQDYKKAIDFLLYATDCLLSGAISLTETAKHKAEFEAPDVQSAHFLLRRVGVTDVARSWTYLAWGRYDAALLIARQAESLIAKEDKLNINLAKSIIGIVTKIKAGTDTDGLALSIEKLSESYQFFKENQYCRYALKILFELCHVYVLTGDTKKAIDLLPHNDSKEDGQLIRMLKENSRWQIQKNLLVSRILSKADVKQIKLLINKGWIGKIGFVLDKEYLLRLALKYAENGLKLANQKQLKENVKESSICVGQTYYELAEYLNRSKQTAHNAKVLFGKSAEIFENASETISQLNVVNQDGIVIPKQLGGMNCNVNDWGYCKLFLAKIALARNDIQEAEKNLLFYQALQPIENGLVKELADEVEKKIHLLSEKTMVIEIDEHDGYDHLLYKFLKTVDEKYKFSSDEISLADRHRSLNITRDKAKGLIKKVIDLDRKLNKDSK